MAAFLAAVGSDPDAEVLRVKNRFDPGYVIAFGTGLCTALAASILLQCCSPSRSAHAAVAGCSNWARLLHWQRL